MKKTLSFVVCLLFILVLSACNETAKTTTNTKKSNESDLTLNEVMKNSMESSKSLKSFAIDLDLDQTMEMGGQSEKVHSITNANVEMTIDPLAFYQQFDMKMDQSNENIKAKIYYTDMGVYFFEETSKTWMKFPKEMTEQFKSLSMNQPNPAEELEKIHEFIDDMKFEQNDQSFILSLKASGDKFQSLIEESIQQSLPPELASENLLKDTKINKIDYTVHIDKKSFYPSKIYMVMDMEVNGEEKVHMIINMKADYSKFNKINKITVPKDVISSAEEIEI